jgi:hypothetical protein
MRIIYGYHKLLFKKQLLRLQGKKNASEEEAYY